jgi:hypothetical protein
MPIQDVALKKTFVLVPDTATVAQAAATLRQAGGQGFWTLLVTHNDGHIGATTFNELAKLIDKFGPALFAARLADLPVPLKARPTIEADSVDVHTAQVLADRRGMLVVTSKGVPVGMMSSERREVLFAASSLVELYGEYIQLSEDARAAWKPNGKQPPTQPCKHRAWPELAANGKWVCSQCKRPIGKD